MMKRQAERMADTFGMDTVEQLLSKVESGAGGDNCIVCGQVSVTMSPSVIIIMPCVRWPRVDAPAARNRNIAAKNVSNPIGHLTSLSATNDEYRNQDFL